MAMTAADVLRGAGGQFAGSQSRGGSKSTAGKGSKSTKAGMSSAAAGPMSYDPRTRRGTGYGKHHGDLRVHQLQEALTRLGILDGHGRKLVSDGKLGPLTTHAVMTAQRLMGIRPDGVVTPALLSRLLSMSPPPPPKKTAAAGSKSAKKKRTVRSVMRGK